MAGSLLVNGGGGEAHHSGDDGDDGDVPRRSSELLDSQRYLYCILAVLGHGFRELAPQQLLFHPLCDDGDGDDCNSNIRDRLKDRNRDQKYSRTLTDGAADNGGGERDDLICSSSNFAGTLHPMY